MLNMLDLNWFYQSPIDFEHKNYLLLQYLSNIDSSYSKRVLSPYLLWTEKLVIELEDFKKKSKDLESTLRTKLIGFDFKNFKLIRAEVKKNEEIEMIWEIVEWSTPILNEKINLGYKLLKKYPQLLY